MGRIHKTADDFAGDVVLEFDFADELLFPWIDTLVYSVTSKDGNCGGGHCSHSAMTPVGTAAKVQVHDVGAGVELSVTMVVTQAGDTAATH